MKMKAKTIPALCAVLSAAMGIALGVFRSSLIAQYTDEATGRLLVGSARGFAPFFIAAVVCAALLAVLALYARRIPLQCGLRPAGTGLKTVRVLSAFLLLASAVLLLLTTDSVSLLTVLKSIFLVACSGACIVFAMGRSTQSKGLCTLFPLFFMCVYLLCFYRDTARNPLTYTFAFEILSVIFLVLALYLFSCPWFGKRRPGAFFFFTMAATMGAAGSVVTALLSRGFYHAYLPAGPADGALVLAMLLWVWSEIFEETSPLPPQPEKNPGPVEE